MRILEISFISVDFILLVICFARKGSWNGSMALLAYIAFILCIAQIGTEGSRWQMYPAYAVAAALALIATVQYLPLHSTTPLRIAIGIALLLSAVVLGSLFPIFSLPDPGGPDAIGTVTRQWFRATHDPHEQLDAQDSRKLTVQFWYPAVRDPAARPAPYRTNSTGKLMARYLQLVPTHSQLDVPVAPSQRTYPVILFSPMWNSGRTQNTFEFEMLASHGFVVASIEHPQDDAQQDASYSSADSVSRKDVEVFRRANDVRFVLDQLAKMNNSDPAHLMTGRLDLSRVGITGHSFGGAAAAESCWLDPRIKAGINMDGTMFGQVGDVGASQPFFFMFSDGPVSPPESALNSSDTGTRYQTQIDYRDAKRDEAWFREHGGYRLLIRGSLHLNYSDKPMYSPIKKLTDGGSIDPGRAMQIINAYTLAFFEKHLNNRTEPLLDGPSGLYPEVEFEAFPPPKTSPPVTVQKIGAAR